MGRALDDRAPAAEPALPAVLDGQPAGHGVAREVGEAAAAGVRPHVDEELDAGGGEQGREAGLVEGPVPDGQEQHGR